MDQRTRKHTVIAIVDDDDTVRRALSRLVRAAGYRVQVFASGSAFFEWLAHSEVACVVTDLYMPGVSGFDVLSQLRQHGGIPAIVITAHHDAGTEQKVRDLGAIACLPKPVEGDVLLATIASALVPNAG